MKIGFLGPKGSFSYRAATQTYGDQTYQSFSTIVDCLQAVENNLITTAVIPIENSYEGTVRDTLDFLYHQGHLFVEKEIILPIHHYLAIHKEHKLDAFELETVYSHPQALSQTEQFLRKNYPKASPFFMDSTARSAQYVAEDQGRHKIGAICSEEAAKIYDLQIIRERIEDSDDNQTRFWCLSKIQNKQGKIDNQKMSVCVTLPTDRPGALHQILAALSWRNINLSKIESRPLKTQLGSYFFLLDITIDCPISLIYLAFDEIRLLNVELKELGAYSIDYPE